MLVTNLLNTNEEVKPQKKVLLLMAGQIRPNPPPPRAKWPLKFWNVEKKRLKKVTFSLMAGPLPPPPLLMARSLREELFLRLP